MTRLVSIILVSASLLITGCANTNGATQQKLSSKDEAFMGSLPDGSIRADTTDERVANLWSAAERSRVKDDDQQALSYLYEALEISPQNSLLWSRAAELQLNSREPQLAESFAEKSNVFADANAPLLHRNWLIIEHARSMRGDLLGVRSAHKKVQEYRYKR